MSVVPPQTPPAAPPTAAPEEITIVSHSNLFYWWPVWAVGFLIAALTFLDNQYMAIVPAKTEALESATVITKTGDKLVNREVLMLPEGKELAARVDPAKKKGSPPANPRLHIAKGRAYGVLFATVLLVVIVLTNIPLRGMWSIMVIVLAVLLSVIFALAGWWEIILFHLSLLDIRINAGGYLFISLPLFLIWLFVMLLFDRQIYMVFTPGQFRVCTEVGGGEQVYDATGMTLEKKRSDFFRHWLLGFGSGDLVVKTSGAQAHHFDLPNVLFVNKKKEMIEKMLKRRAVTEAH